MKKIFLYCAVVSIPLLLLACVWQSERYITLQNEITHITKRQESIIESNQRLIAEIASLSSAARIERVAKSSLGLEKKQPEEVIEVLIKKADANGVSAGNK